MLFLFERWLGLPLTARSFSPAHPGRVITPTRPKPARQASFHGDAPFTRGEGLLYPHSFHLFHVSAVWFPSTARIEGAHSDRAASASKGGNHAASSLFSPRVARAGRETGPPARFFVCCPGEAEAEGHATPAFLFFQGCSRETCQLGAPAVSRLAMYPVSLWSSSFCMCRKVRPKSHPWAQRTAASRTITGTWEPGR